jgi:hypothetical protein
MSDLSELATDKLFVYSSRTPAQIGAEQSAQLPEEDRGSKSSAKDRSNTCSQYSCSLAAVQKWSEGEDHAVVADA